MHCKSSLIDKKKKRRKKKKKKKRKQKKKQQQKKQKQTNFAYVKIDNGSSSYTCTRAPLITR